MRSHNRALGPTQQPDQRILGVEDVITSHRVDGGELTPTEIDDLYAQAVAEQSRVLGATALADSTDAPEAGGSSA